MGMRVELPQFLAELRHDLCSRNAAHWGECKTCLGPGLPCAEDQLDQRLIDRLMDDDDQGNPEFRRFLDGMRCDRCLLVLALKGVDKVLPGEPGRAWLHASNPDLEGRTPVESLEAGQCRAVIDALWLNDPESDAG